VVQGLVTAGVGKPKLVYSYIALMIYKTVDGAVDDALGHAVFLDNRGFSFLF